jgi:hypothetical protein
MKKTISYYLNIAAARISRTQSKLKRSWASLQFDRSIHSLTIENHDQVIADAERALSNKSLYEAEDVYAASDDQMVRQGHALKIQVEQEFKGKYAARKNERIMIHVPDPILSPAGFSLFTNLAECLDFLGVPTHILGWNDNTEAIIDEFKPTLLVSSDHASYLERIDWEAIKKYRAANHLKIGLTASLEEYGNTPLIDRLAWANKFQIDFYYSFRDETYVNDRAEYRPFFDAGYKILYLPFGANILHYYPIAGFKRDIDFVLIASKKREHTIFMKDIVKRHYGFIDGPGWKHAHHFRFNRDRDRYIYARAKVGLNVHLPEQIDWACEVNERTYQLAACGVPQIVDHPKLLDKLFSTNAMFIADTPRQFEEYFDAVVRDSAIGLERARVAQEEVFRRHTTFHRAESFIQQVGTL